jgi:hypothetical protein
MRFSLELGWRFTQLGVVFTLVAMGGCQAAEQTSDTDGSAARGGTAGALADAAAGSGGAAGSAASGSGGSVGGGASGSAGSIGAGSGGAAGSAGTAGSSGASGSGDAGIAPSDWCVNGDSVLARAIRGLPSRSWTKLPDNAGLTALQMSYSLLYWNDSGVWDPRTRRVHWVGGPGTCCADPADFKRISYDVATDTWTIADTPFSGSGHAYDGNALDPATGDHFFALFGQRQVHRLHEGTWTKLGDLPWTPNVAVGMAWFAALDQGRGELVYVNGYGQLARYDGSAWHEISGAEEDPWGSYNTFAEYNPVHRSCGSAPATGTKRSTT